MILNKKGFTLIELLAAIVLFAIVAGFGTYSITNVIKASKEKNYNLLIKNIKDAAEVYYQECQYGGKEKINFNGNNYNSNKCNVYKDAYYDGYIITLGDMVENGYLTGNLKNKNGNYKIVNPNKETEDYTNCLIGVEYNNDLKKVRVISAPSGLSPAYCPDNYGE